MFKLCRVELLCRVAAKFAEFHCVNDLVEFVENDLVVVCLLCELVIEAHLLVVGTDTSARANKKVEPQACRLQQTRNVRAHILGAAEAIEED